MVPSDFFLLLKGEKLVMCVYPAQHLVELSGIRHKGPHTETGSFLFLTQGGAEI